MRLTHLAYCASRGMLVGPFLSCVVCLLSLDARMWPRGMRRKRRHARRPRCIRNEGRRRSFQRFLQGCCRG